MGNRRVVPNKSKQPFAARDRLISGSLQGTLHVLPSELVFRVLSFLSAEDLTAAAPVCRHFRTAVAGNILWKRLFVARCDLQDHMPAFLTRGSTPDAHFHHGRPQTDFLKALPPQHLLLWETKEIASVSSCFWLGHADGAICERTWRL